MATVLHREKTDHQDLIIFDNPCCGRVLGLDGVIQTTQADEYIYHEMLVQPALVAHGRVTRLLIVGGGDGAAAREALKHDDQSADPGRLRVTMVDIDATVIDLCRRYLPAHGDGALDDPRLDLIIDDAARFVARTDRCFDAIIIDSPDPIGPAKTLFTESFYRHCRRILNPGGVLVAQNGVPFLQQSEMIDSHRRLAGLFSRAGVFTATVPSYCGGVMAFAWGGDNRDIAVFDRDRAMRMQPHCRYYNADIHFAAFALGSDLRRVLDRARLD